MIAQQASIARIRLPILYDVPMEHTQRQVGFNAPVVPQAIVVKITRIQLLVQLAGTVCWAGCSVTLA